MTKESNLCSWCEDLGSKLILYSKSKGSIIGFCSEECWQSFSEILFDDVCSRCNKKAKLLSVSEKNKDDLINDDFSQYCDNCFQNTQNSERSDTKAASTAQSTAGTNSKTTPSSSAPRSQAASKANDSSSSKAAASVPNPASAAPSSSPAVDKNNNPNVSSNLNHQSTPAKVAVALNHSTASSTPVSTPAGTPAGTPASTPQSVKKPRAFKNHQPYEIYGCFNWQNYLELEGSSPAPADCFKQNTDPPINEFELNMKLEAPDPRNPSSTCIATVVSLMGFRIELRLDGSDNTNDFWLPVDDENIHPIGHTQSKGEMLQPPLGFRKNPSAWPIFVTSTLNGAKLAPKECFKTSPRSPAKNFFKIGQKLEAVDRKNPRLICPATVSKVKDSMVYVSFDGWKGAFDYWARFDSRELFPVGWCARSNHPLQMPGNKDLSIEPDKLMVDYTIKVNYMTSNKIAVSRANGVANKSLSAAGTEKGNNADSSSSVANSVGGGEKTPVQTPAIATTNTGHLPTSKEPQIAKESNAAAGQPAKQPPATPTASKVSNQTNNPATAALAAADHATAAAIKPPTGSTHPLAQPQHASLTNSKLSSTLQSASSSSLKTLLLDKNNKHQPKISAPVIAEQPRKPQPNGVNYKVIVSSKMAASSAGSASSLIHKATFPPGVMRPKERPSLSPQLTSNKVESATNKHPLVSVFINPNCNPGMYIEVKEFKRLVARHRDSKIGPSPLNKTMRDVLQLILDCSYNKENTLEMIRAGHGNFYVAVCINGAEAKKNLPHFNRSAAFWNYLNNFLGGLHCCRNLMSHLPASCDRCKESLYNKPLQATSLIGKQPLLIKQPPVIKQHPHQLSNNGNQSLMKPTIVQRSSPVTSSSASSSSSSSSSANSAAEAKPLASAFIANHTPPSHSIHQSTPVIQKKRKGNFDETTNSHSSSSSSNSLKVSSIKVAKTVSSPSSSLANLSNVSNSSTNLIKPAAATTTTAANHQSTPTSSKLNGHVTVLKSEPISINHSAVAELDQPSFSNPNDWTTDEVINFLKMNDESLDYAEMFKSHEIDGKAFLLLNSDMLMKYMKIKLGPALKISQLIEKLKEHL